MIKAIVQTINACHLHCFLEKYFSRFKTQLLLLLDTSGHFANLVAYVQLVSKIRTIIYI